MKYQPTDDNRKFTELYNAQRLSSHNIAADSQVCISTILRLPTGIFYAHGVG